jgi:hypothetical protein
MKYSLRLLAGLAVTFSLGCGKSDAEKFADSYCAEIAKCCGQAGLPADGKVCHQWAAFAEAGGSYNASAGNACLAEIKTEVSAGTFCADQSSSGPSQCDSVYGTSSNGSKKPGETCDFDSDCASSSLGAVACASLYVNGAFIDKCQVRIPGKAGDACIGTQDGLAFASYQTSDATDVPAQGPAKAATAPNVSTATTATRPASCAPRRKPTAPHARLSMSASRVTARAARANRTVSIPSA